MRHTEWWVNRFYYCGKNWNVVYSYFGLDDLIISDIEIWASIIDKDYHNSDYDAIRILEKLGRTFQ